MGEEVQLVVADLDDEQLFQLSTTCREKISVNEDFDLNKALLREVEIERGTRKLATYKLNLDAAETDEDRGRILEKARSTEAGIEKLKVDGLGGEAQTIGF